MRPRAYSFQELQQRCGMETSVSTVPSVEQEEERKEDMEEELRKGAVLSPHPTTTTTGTTIATDTSTTSTTIPTQPNDPDDVTRLAGTRAHSHGVLRVPLPGMVPIPTPATAAVVASKSHTALHTSAAQPDYDYAEEQAATSETMLRE